MLVSKYPVGPQARVFLLALCLSLIAGGCVTRTVRTTYATGGAVTAPSKPSPLVSTAEKSAPAALGQPSASSAPAAGIDISTSADLTALAASDLPQPDGYAPLPSASSAPEASPAAPVAVGALQAVPPAVTAPPAAEASPAAPPAQPPLLEQPLLPPAGPAPAKPSGTLDEEFYKAVLANERQTQAEQVNKRISYPDELSGGAMIRSVQQPGEVTFFYPLKAVGAVQVTIGKDHTVTTAPFAQANVQPVIDTIKRYLDPAKEDVKWYAARNMLEVHALEENVPFIIDLLGFLDAPQPQIIIQAAVWEITDAQDTQLGSSITSARRQNGGTFFDLFNTEFDTQSFLDTLTSQKPFQGSTLEFLSAADAHHAKIGVAFQLLKNHGYADLVSQPRMRVAVGETAKIMTGEQVPIQTVKLITDRLEVYTNYRDVGVQLYVTPTIAAGDSITLSVLPVVSEVIGYTDPGPAGISNPIIATREAQTEVTVANRELITIGGLDQTKKTTTEVKVPILGDIPILGYLFKSKRDTSKKVQLWFTVQPTIAGVQERIIIPELTGARPGYPPK